MNCPALASLIVAVLGAIVGLGTFIKAVIEYRKQGAAKRSDLFLSMRSRLREDPSFKEICTLLENDDPRLRDVPLLEKDRFLGFFEELALLRNSGLINEHVTVYMFGYFAMRCLESSNFWHGLNREHSLWAAFVDFATEMRSACPGFSYERRQFYL
jgi:hypothetical protein